MINGYTYNHQLSRQLLFVLPEKKRIMRHGKRYNYEGKWDKFSDFCLASTRKATFGFNTSYLSAILILRKYRSKTSMLTTLGVDQ